MKIHNNLLSVKLLHDVFIDVRERLLDFRLEDVVVLKKVPNGLTEAHVSCSKVHVVNLTLIETKSVHSNQLPDLTSELVLESNNKAKRIM
jgi:hypothetical protein